MPGFLPSLPSFDRILSGFHCRELLKPCSALINLLGVAGTPPRIFGTIAVRNLPQGWPLACLLAPTNPRMFHPLSDVFFSPIIEAHVVDEMHACTAIVLQSKSIPAALLFSCNTTTTTKTS